MGRTVEQDEPNDEKRKREGQEEVERGATVETNEKRRGRGGERSGEKSGERSGEKWKETSQWREVRMGRKKENQGEKKKLRKEKKKNENKYQEGRKMRMERKKGRLT